jgi:endonuclease/exonuclease/phosphatase family metal-dependent hydrolase
MHLRRILHPSLALLLATAACLLQCQSDAPVGAAGSRPQALPGPAATAAASAQTPAATLRLGSWNLEHFGARDKYRDRDNDLPNRTDAEVEALARFIIELGVDVLALQEVDGAAAMTRLLDLLGADYAFTLGTTGGFKGTFIRVGFLWNRRKVTLLQCEEMTDFPSREGGLAVFHRKPVNAVFRVVYEGAGLGAGLDFRAITVHLMASRGRQNEAKRTTEVTILRRYIERLRADAQEDQDIVVLGDFNHSYGAPAHRAFTEGDTVQYAVGPPTPTIIWFAEPIDHIALTPGIRDEVVAGSFRVHNQRVDFTSGDRAGLEAARQAWRQTYSDHFPVTIDLRATPDNDPVATFAPAVHRLPTTTATARKGH